MDRKAEPWWAHVIIAMMATLTLAAAPYRPSSAFMSFAGQPISDAYPVVISWLATL
jgi:hypothetical protein